MLKHRKLYKTWLLERFASIFYFNSIKQKQKNCGFYNIFWRIFKIFEILIIHKPSLWSREFPHKIWARYIGSAVLSCIGYKQINKQTDRQAKYIYRKIRKCAIISKILFKEKHKNVTLLKCRLSSN